MDFDGLKTRVRELLSEAFELRYRGELHTKKVRAQAYADGYMRALEDSGVLSRDELRGIVAEERHPRPEAKELARAV